jgi:hypothetical protein
MDWRATWELDKRHIIDEGQSALALLAPARVPWHVSCTELCNSIDIWYHDRKCSVLRWASILASTREGRQLIQFARRAGVGMCGPNACHRTVLMSPVKGSIEVSCFQIDMSDQTDMLVAGLYSEAEPFYTWISPFQ